MYFVLFFLFISFSLVFLSYINFALHPFQRLIKALYDVKGECCTMVLFKFWSAVILMHETV